ALSTRDRIPFNDALRKAADAPGISVRSANAIADFVTLMDGLRELAGTALPEEVLEAALQRSGYLTELEESLDTQDAGRVENLQELVSVAREYSERVLATAAVAEEDETGTPDLPGFLEQVSLVADADEVPSDDPEHQGVL